MVVSFIRCLVVGIVRLQVSAKNRKPLGKHASTAKVTGITTGSKAIAAWLKLGPS